LFKYFYKSALYQVIGTVKTISKDACFDVKANIYEGVDATNMQSIQRVISDVRPDVVINCIGLIKQRPTAYSTQAATFINGIFPHLLANITNGFGIRLVHFSTDCVFSGRVGYYSETDMPDTQDLYGLSKLFGEVVEGNVLTLRTSIIGHEYETNYSLLSWFLSQKQSVPGYTRAFFSGLTTLEVAKVVQNFVIENQNLKGMYHLAAERICKYDLLKVIKEIYDHNIQIIPSEDIIIDRTLISKKFEMATGYLAPSWKDMISDMYKFNNSQYAKA
jgi:dTDP-4-dehydrorhamnose reductase